MIVHATLAMHMANELLSIPVAVVTLCVAGVAVIACSWRASRGLDAERFPLMGVIGAFVFAAQMINFPLPGLPVSGHLGGAVLLAILLGPAGAVITMTAIVLVQCLFFQDGGLLALGCNVINIGIVPAVLGYGVYRLVLGRKGASAARRQYVAAFSAALVGVTAGAAMVPLQTHLSGVLPFHTPSFLAVMVAIHLVIGAIEGAITFAVVAFVRHVRPAALGLDASARYERLTRKALVASLLVTAVLLAGVVSWFASEHPDGLEWSVQEQGIDIAAPAGETDTPAGFRADAWASVGAVAGTALTLILVHAAAKLLRRRRVIESDGA